MAQQPALAGVEPRFVLNAAPIYWSFAIFSLLFGMLLLAAPRFCFGPTWETDKFLSTAHIWMGLLSIVLSNTQMVALALQQSAQRLSLLFLISALKFWIVGLAFTAEGIIHQTGMMEAPLFILLGVQAFAHSAVLRTYFREEAGDG